METGKNIEQLIAEKEAELNALKLEKSTLHAAANCLERGVPSLEKVPALSTNKEGDEPASVLIEGDNVHSMLNLSSFLSDHFDIIYADPPYNTGKTFTYSDNRNDKWLEFMRERLTLAYALLKPGGVIFLSINDEELAYLKILMDELFGRRNFIANFVWRNSSKSGARRVNLDHEYVLCYTKPGKPDGSSLQRWSTVKHEKQVDEMYRTVERAMPDLREARRQLNLYVRKLIASDDQYKWLKNYSHVRVNENGAPQIYYTVDLSVPGKPNSRQLKNGTVLPPLPDRGWQSAEKIDRLIDEGLVSWKGERPYQVNVLTRRHRSGVSSVLPKIYTRNGKEELKRMFGGQAPFDFPKPLRLIKTLLSFTDQPDAAVLDFFAGSGTTAHAVAELNSEDGGRRTCVSLTTNSDSDSSSAVNEHRIAETVTSPRIVKALTGEGWADSKPRTPLPGQLTYYRVSFNALPTTAVFALDKNLQQVEIETQEQKKL